MQTYMKKECRVTHVRYGNKLLLNFFSNASCKNSNRIGIKYLTFDDDIALIMRRINFANYSLGPSTNCSKTNIETRNCHQLHIIIHIALHKLKKATNSTT
jgi:hypothetical protein